MIIGIVGLPKSGKTTIFNAVTGSKAQTDAFISEESSNVAVVKVPDERVEKLYGYFKDPKKIFVELKFIDFAPFHKGMGEKGFPAKHLGDLRACDALLLAVRAFESEAAPNPEKTVDPARDAETLFLELALADLEVIERRLERIEQGMHRGSKDERPMLEKEKVLMLRFKDILENGERLDVSELSGEEFQILRNFGFLTIKPLICVLNIHENDIGKGVSEKAAPAMSGKNLPVIELSGKIEMDIAALDEEDRPGFMEELGIKEAGRDKVLRSMWELLGLIVFLTVGDDEVRAWPLKKGENAVAAASRIHSDIARGFIRAEVVLYSDFIEHGGFAGVKTAGKFRLEGKEYIPKDGDIIHFRFNV